MVRSIFLGYFAFQLLTASLPPLYALALGADEAAIGLLTGLLPSPRSSRPWIGWWLDRGGSRWGMLAAGTFYAWLRGAQGVPHRTRVPARSVILMVERDMVIPTGDTLHR